MVKNIENKKNHFLNLILYDKKWYINMSSLNEPLNRYKYFVNLDNNSTDKYSVINIHNMWEDWDVILMVKISKIK